MSWFLGLRLPCTHSSLGSLSLIAVLSTPAFVKLPSSKDFEARVYRSGADVSDGIAVLISEVVDSAAKFRPVPLDGVVHTWSRHATWGRLDPTPLAPTVL